MIRILVVDDQRLVRRCIAAKLNGVDGFEVAAEADSGERARDVVRETDIDIVLLDLNMPGIGGLEATRRVVSSDPTCKVIGLSMYIEGLYPRRFMELGGSGYVSKAADTDELVHAIRTVAAGEPYISNDVAQRIAINDSIKGSFGGLNDLSSREIQVLQKIAEGLNIDEIASVMSLSPQTVAHNRRVVCAKLGAKNDVQLAITANAQGLSELSDLTPAAADLSPAEKA